MAKLRRHCNCPLFRPDGEAMGTLDDIRTVERIGWLTLALPLFPIIVLLSYALIMSFQMGHFPPIGNPSRGMGVLFPFVELSTLLLPFLWLPLSTVSIIFLLISGLQKRNVLRKLVIVLVAYAFYIGFMAVDPSGLMRWIFD
jgi:hypothetical protein